MTSITRLDIPEVVLITPPRFQDSRGYFSETYKKAALDAAGLDFTFVQDNESLSTTPGTIRGLHYQAPPFAQAKLVRVVSGSIFDVAVDIRKGSPTYGKWVGATLTAEGGEQLLIPHGFAHAFCTLTPDVRVLYKVDGAYSKASEGGIIWDDPDVAITWPVKEAVVSEKDAILPRLKDLDSPFVYS
ncbi:dTDP-4-dehydrorhamnose 3,5-epimerase [Azorhizobium oxalatiphilum]|uniref:dTDP-4-dehydrorhamnose 3,5-epimerase n=1 Tax=Azorhizobium oxalatiphilum TaxID=980631 RepID=A0A917C0F0_9HYPH|nr:dTDP-4-dehydrorhamnose 3,5-epimerase [Azorhizobium oxalatiphilum]GGF62039.1 dTDP-4-dehydrorhamnose 3,5-epimerase [Azorhizobium oxalatiphilum]